MTEYFKIKYNIELQYGHFPAIAPLTQGKGPKKYYPLELLKILPNQRVPLEKMHEKLTNAIINVIFEAYTYNMSM